MDFFEYEDKLNFLTSWLTVTYTPTQGDLINVCTVEYVSSLFVLIWLYFMKLFFNAFHTVVLKINLLETVKHNK